MTTGFDTSRAWFSVVWRYSARPEHAQDDTIYRSLLEVADSDDFGFHASVQVFAHSVLYPTRDVTKAACAAWLGVEKNLERIHENHDGGVISFPPLIQLHQPDTCDDLASDFMSEFKNPTDNNTY